MILFLYRDEYYYPDTEKKNTAELNIAKQRNGPTGTIALTWMPRSTTFRSAAGSGRRRKHRQRNGCRDIFDFKADEVIT